MVSLLEKNIFNASILCLGAIDLLMTIFIASVVATEYKCTQKNNAHMWRNFYQPILFYRYLFNIVAADKGM